MSFTKDGIKGCVSALAVAATLFVAPSLSAHEFWVSPSKGQVEPGEALSADLKVGIQLKGDAFPYLSNRFARFDITADGGVEAIEGLDGDLPAIANVTAKKGLNIITHQAVAFLAKYDDWPAFQRYMKEEGIPEFEQRHLDLGFPKARFGERYTRYAKALVQAGPVAETDKDNGVGMLFELVAETNPYRDGSSEIQVQLLWQGKPMPHRQINVFHDGEGEPSRAFVKTDAVGRAVIRLSGEGEYLFNAVHLSPTDDKRFYEDRPIVWHSHWATLGFKL